MGVIKRIENLFEIKCSLSEETLYIPSGDDGDDDSDNDGVNTINGYEVNFSRHGNNAQGLHHSRGSRNHPPTIGPIFSNPKSHCGRKKFRRFNTVNQLLTLAEENELEEVTIEDFIGNPKSAFSMLLQDEKCLQTWNEFVSISEDHQHEILEGSWKKRDCGGQRPIINRALRSLLRKKHLPLGMLDYLERELLAFFSAEPTKTYVSPALTSFERLLLHSISSYHRLASLSFVSEPEKIKLVRVRNPRDEFTRSHMPLIQYLKTNYGVS